MKLKENHKRILQDCLHDYVGLWDLIKDVYPEIQVRFPLPNWVLNSTLEEVREMLNTGLFLIGSHNPENKGEEFIPFTMSIDEIAMLIEREWKSKENTNNNLYIGYFCWFQASPTGKEIAQELGLI